jgi:hypothetical protein
MTVPFLFGCLVTTPETYHQAGIRRGTVTQRSTLRGTTSIVESITAIKVPRVVFDRATHL